MHPRHTYGTNLFTSTESASPTIARLRGSPRHMSLETQYRDRRGTLDSTCRQGVTLQLLLEDLCGICAALSAICNVWMGYLAARGGYSTPSCARFMFRIRFPSTKVMQFWVSIRHFLPPPSSRILFFVLDGCRHFFDLIGNRIDAFDKDRYTVLFNAGLTDDPNSWR